MARKYKKRTERQKNTDLADDLCRALVRGRGYCEAAGLDKVRCNGMLQWCHIVGRGNKRLRWETWNALCMCQGHHVYYTHHPEEWFLDFIPTHFNEQFKLIQKYRNDKWDKDLDSVINRLKKVQESSVKAIDSI